MEETFIGRCPDCGRKLKTIIVERSSDQIYKLDWENKELVERGKKEEQDYCFRCPACNSLNVDQLVGSFFSL